MWEEPEDITDPAPGYGYVADTTAERDIYFFHTDHLGSTAYLTDRDGKISQFVCYTPYGEALVDEHATTYENPFKFSGKELDDITGLYDHGARSRDPKLTMWYGVDPLFEKYPDFSPYSYCMGNPVRFVDPDGKKFTESGEEWATNLEEEVDAQLAKVKSGSKKEKELTATKEEIQKLRESEQVYDVRTYEKEARSGETDLRGFVSYDQDKDQFVINLNTKRDANTEGSDLGAFAHELKHAYQFEMGQLSFKKTGGGITKAPGSFYDINDENEAHNRGWIFGAGNRYPERNTYSNLKKEEASVKKKDEFQLQFYKKPSGRLYINVVRYNGVTY